MHARRNKFDPLWNSIVIAGRDATGTNFLGFVDLLGTSFRETVVATGYGAALALPLMRAAVDALPPNTLLSRDAAKALLERCMRVLFYRDARALNKIQLADVSDAGVSVTEPYALPTDWQFGERVSHAAEGSW
jgi:20S proteasome subunit beta 7